MLNEKKCYYHPDRTAESLCGKCGKLLCDECQCKFKLRFASRNPAGSEITIPEVMCIDCYKSEIEHIKKARLWYFIIIISILVVTGTITWISLHFS